MAYKDPQTGEYKEISVVGGKTSIIQTVSTYQASTSGTIIPTGEWLDNVPAVPQAHYLWSRIELRWNTGQTTMLYTCARQGLDGSGSVSSVNDVSPDSSGNVALPIDNAPTSGSTNPVTSGGAYTALAEKVSKSGDTMTGPLHITRENNFPELSFNRYNYTEDNTQCMIQPTMSSETALRFGFYQRLAGSTAWEGFGLPPTTVVLTSGNVNYDILTSKPNSGNLYYGAGETYSTSVEMMMCGHITNGVRNIHLGLWLPKSLERINSISITTLAGSMRGVNGYINSWTSTNILTQPGITVTAARTTPNGIRLNIAKSSDLTNAVANTPVTFSGRITLSFS